MFSINCKGRLISLTQPIVMGIINITPDSFFEGSRNLHLQDLLRQAEQMILEGATILDLGAQSTTPTSIWLEPEREWERLQPVLTSLVQYFPEVIFSIDTFHHTVAKNAVNAGVHIVNDISGGNLDPEMLPTVSALGVPYICMHMKGTPQSMQTLAQYDNISLEVMDYFVEKITACKKAGIKDIILDPGFGFAKTIQHNFDLLNQLEVLKTLHFPLLVGISRKSTIYRTLGITPVEALNGTTVLNTIALIKGTSILRVHDVREAVEAIKLIKSMNNFQ